MDWLSYPLFAITSLLLMVIAILILFFRKQLASIATILLISSIAIQILFIILIWIHLNRPPLRTLGETRMWYSFFVMLIGYITYHRWRYTWFLAYTTFMTAVFMSLNLSMPENFDKTLMPALQSYWFVPHVVVYIIGYAMLAVSTLVAIKGLYEFFKGKIKPDVLVMADNLVYVGFAFLTSGLLFGALWAKEAWGHYWTWDPKETWAFLTWLGYLLYIHFRMNKPKNVIVPLWILSLAFIILLIAWFGINYLPSAQNSVHVYSQQ